MGCSAILCTTHRFSCLQKHRVFESRIENCKLPSIFQERSETRSKTSGNEEQLPRGSGAKIGSLNNKFLSLFC